MGRKTAAAKKVLGIEEFGRDHWALLAYVETLCVDGQGGIGVIDRRRMRCNRDTHPMLCGVYGVAWDRAHGTRLAGWTGNGSTRNVSDEERAGFLLGGHDDWDCLDELESAGLVEVLSVTAGHVRMSKEGQELAARLREHKGRGGSFGSFSTQEAAA